MNREEQLEAMLSKAQRLGLELRFSNGLLTMQKTREVDDDLLKAMASNLSERAAEVRTIAERHAISEHGMEFIGARIWLEGHGEGTLDGISADGRLSVRVRSQAFNCFVSLTAPAETVVILDERPSESLAPQRDGGSTPVRPKGLIQTVRDRFRGEA